MVTLGLDFNIVTTGLSLMISRIYGQLKIDSYWEWNLSFEKAKLGTCIFRLVEEEAKRRLKICYRSFLSIIYIMYWTRRIETRTIVHLNHSLRASSVVVFAGCCDVNLNQLSKVL